MAYQNTNLGQPITSTGELREYEQQQLAETESKLGRLWDGFKKYGKKYLLDPLVDTFGDRVPEVVNTSIEILADRGEAAIVKAIQDGPGTAEEKERLIVAAASLVLSHHQALYRSICGPARIAQQLLRTSHAKAYK